jgi:hypothetical protein
VAPLSRATMSGSGERAGEASEGRQVFGPGRGRVCEVETPADFVAKRRRRGLSGPFARRSSRGGAPRTRPKSRTLRPVRSQELEGRRPSNKTEVEDSQARSLAGARGAAPLEQDRSRGLSGPFARRSSRAGAPRTRPKSRTLRPVRSQELEGLRPSNKTISAPRTRRASSSPHRPPRRRSWLGPRGHASVWNRSA